MKFKVDVVRRMVTASLAAVLLASCGGGTEIEAFVPNRVIAFGDEASIILDDQDPPAGRKYTVNGVVFDNTVTPPTATPACTVNQIWVQMLAYSYGMAFPGCPTAGYAAVGLMYAKAGDGAAGLAAQVDKFFSDGRAFTNKDIVTVMAGANDIKALYDTLQSGVASSTLIALAGQAGNAVGAQVVRITDRGAKVVVSTVPSLGLTPFAGAEERINPGRAKLLSDMSDEFNKQLRLKLEDVRDGGHAVGLILSHELVLSMTQVPFAYPPLTNVSEVACPETPGLPNCDMTTLTESATPSNGAALLWADDRRLGATAHAYIGNLAINRARSNPF